ncbi:MAG: DUF5004 domain-containing protein [Bacteroidales bacterium]
MRRYILKYVFALAVAVSFSACKTNFDSFDDEYNGTEAVKSVEGNWKILEASRNDVEITELMDLSKFRLVFNNDQSYTIENPLPFIVSDAGTYSLDDPQYPFVINFREDGASEATSANFVFRNVNGVRQFSLNFSSGCTSNSYRYVLVKDVETN